jgi:hypothetical protein
MDQGKQCDERSPGWSRRLFPKTIQCKIGGCVKDWNSAKRLAGGSIYLIKRGINVSAELYASTHPKAAQRPAIENCGQPAV